MTGVYINRLASFLPNEPVSNEDMEAILGQIGPRPSRARRIVLRNNGIRRRYYAIDPATGEQTHSNRQMTAEAVRRLFGDGFELARMDVLACGTSSADQLMPNHAVMVHGELGAPPCETVAPSGICVSGVTALKYAWLSILAGQGEYAVATGSELASSFMRARNLDTEELVTETDEQVEKLDKHPQLAFEKDFLRWMLSDGAGAALLSARPSPDALSLRIDWIEKYSYASELDTCMYAGADKNSSGSLTGWREHASVIQAARDGYFAVKQDVRLLEEGIRVSTEKSLTETLRRHPMQPEEIDWFLPHYSSKYFRSIFASGLEEYGFGISDERWFSNLTEKGNVGAGSIYLMLDELFHSGQLQDGQRLLCYVPESGRFSAAWMHMTAVAG